MKALIKYSAALSWLVAALTVLPLERAAAEQPQASRSEAQLERLLTLHDVRYALHVAPAVQTKCAQPASEDKQ